jgi:hypothetical protein
MEYFAVSNSSTSADLGDIPRGTGGDKDNGDRNRNRAADQIAAVDSPLWDFGLEFGLGLGFLYRL